MLNFRELDTHTHTQWVCVSGEIISVDWTSVNFLILLLHCNHARCYHWRKLSKEYTRPPCAILSNILWIYNYSPPPKLKKIKDIFISHLILSQLIYRNLPWQNKVLPFQAPTIITERLTNQLLFECEHLGVSILPWNS